MWIPLAVLLTGTLMATLGAATTVHLRGVKDRSTEGPKSVTISGMILIAGGVAMLFLK